MLYIFYLIVFMSFIVFQFVLFFNHLISFRVALNFRHSWQGTSNVFRRTPLIITFLNDFYDPFHCFRWQFFVYIMYPLNKPYQTIYCGLQEQSLQWRLIFISKFYYCIYIRNANQENIQRFFKIGFFYNNFLCMTSIIISFAWLLEWFKERREAVENDSRSERRSTTSMTFKRKQADRKQATAFAALHCWLPSWMTFMIPFQLTVFCLYHVTFKLALPNYLLRSARTVFSLKTDFHI